MHTAFMDYLSLLGGAREICDHYGLPWPLALASTGTLYSLPAIGAAVDEYCEKTSSEAAGAGSGDASAREGSTPHPAPAAMA